MLSLKDCFPTGDPHKICKRFTAYKFYIRSESVGGGHLKLQIRILFLIYRFIRENSRKTVRDDFFAKMISKSSNGLMKIENH